MKEQLVKFDGTALFPPRYAYVVPYDLSGPEAALYEQVTTYVREEMNRAERLKAEGEGKRGLDRRLRAHGPPAPPRVIPRGDPHVAQAPARPASSGRSPRPLLQRDGAQARISQPGARRDHDRRHRGDRRRRGDRRGGRGGRGDRGRSRHRRQHDRRAPSRDRTAQASSRPSPHRSGSSAPTRSGPSSRRSSRSAPEMRDAGGGRRKLIVFTEHRDTLDYLVERIGTFLGRPEAIVAIHGGLPRDQRRAAETAFKNDPAVVVLVATDAAGEGINLQRAHLMVNYDLPWNPNRLEQRFGRIHRIGQTEVCHLWNLVAAQDPRGRRLRPPAREARRPRRRPSAARVFDVLGRAHVRGQAAPRSSSSRRSAWATRPEVRTQMTRVIDDGARRRAPPRPPRHPCPRGRTSSTRPRSPRSATSSSAPRRTGSSRTTSATSSSQAYRRLGGQVREREPGRYELTKVPGRIRDRAREAAMRPGVLGAYERIAFEKDRVAVAGLPLAEFVCPGHPLLEATIDLVLQDHRELLRRGARAGRRDRPVGRAPGPRLPRARDRRRTTDPRRAPDGRQPSPRVRRARRRSMPAAPARRPTSTTDRCADEERALVAPDDRRRRLARRHDARGPRHRLRDRAPRPLPPRRGPRAHPRP